MTDIASQPISSNEGVEVPTASITQTTAPDGAIDAKSVEGDRLYVTRAEYEDFHRFERLVARIADWTDDELSAVDARQTRHIARVVVDGANPEYPNFAAGQVQGSETDVGATQVPGDTVSASDGPEIGILDPGEKLDAAIRAAIKATGGLADACHDALKIEELERERDTARDLACLFRETLTGVRDYLAKEDRFALTCKIIDNALETEGLIGPANVAATEDEPDRTQQEQRATFEAIADEPRPTAVQIKAALDELEEQAGWIGGEGSQSWGTIWGVGAARIDGVEYAKGMRNAAGILDNLAVHCLALEIERDDLSAKLDRIAEQAKPVDGTELAELCQQAERFAEHLGPVERAGAATVRKLIGAVNDQARKLAAFDVEAPANTLEMATSAIMAHTVGREPAEHWSITMSRLRWVCLERTKERDQMEVDRDAATDVVKDLEHDLAACRSELTKADDRWSEMNGEMAAAIEDRDKADAAHGCAVRDHREQLRLLGAAMAAGVVALDQIETAFVEECARTAKLKRKALQQWKDKRTYTDADRRKAIDALESAVPPAGGTRLFYRGCTVDVVATALGMRKAEA